jgi:hypothetical protein
VRPARFAFIAAGITAHVAVREDRLAKLAAAPVVLLEAINNGAERHAAKEIWEQLRADLEPKYPR